jgi:hypothetical protein
MPVPVPGPIPVVGPGALPVAGPGALPVPVTVLVTVSATEVTGTPIMSAPTTVAIAVHR